MTQRRLKGIEVCIDSLASAVCVLECAMPMVRPNPAQTQPLELRLEVCSSLAQGGLTPSMGLVSSILDYVKAVRRSAAHCDSESSGTANGSWLFGDRVGLHLMVRCRPGEDYEYTPSEMTHMLADVRAFSAAFAANAAVQSNVI